MFPSIRNKSLLIILALVFGLSFLFAEIMLQKGKRDLVAREREEALSWQQRFYQSDVEKIARNWLISFLESDMPDADNFSIKEIAVLQCRACYRILYEVTGTSGAHSVEVIAKEDVVRSARLDEENIVFASGLSENLFSEKQLFTIKPVKEGTGTEIKPPRKAVLRVSVTLADASNRISVSEVASITVDLANPDLPILLRELADNIMLGEKRVLLADERMRKDIEQFLGKQPPNFSEISIEAEAVAVIL